MFHFLQNFPTINLQMFIENNKLNKKPNERINNKGHTLPSKPTNAAQYSIALTKPLLHLPAEGAV